MEITVWRDTPSAAASSACDISRWVRCSRTRFRMMSRYLYPIGDVKHPLQHRAVRVVPAASSQARGNATPAFVPGPWIIHEATGTALGPRSHGPCGHGHDLCKQGLAAA